MWNWKCQLNWLLKTEKKKYPRMGFIIGKIYSLGNAE